MTVGAGRAVHFADVTDDDGALMLLPAGGHDEPTARGPVRDPWRRGLATRGRFEATVSIVDGGEPSASADRGVSVALA